jgi:MFS family permease
VALKVDETGALRSFRHRNFRLLFASNFISNVGSWAQRIAQDWLVLELTHSGRDLGLVTGLQFLPSLLLSMYAGSLADRMNKRKLLILTNLGAGLTSLILGLLVVTHHVRIWHVFVLALFLGIFGALDAPVRQAFTSEMVGKSDLANAVSLNSANFNAGRLIGPGVSGLLIAAFHTGPSFLLNASSYIFVLGSLVAVRESDLFMENLPKSSAKASEGIKYVRARPDILAVMIVVFFTGTFGLNFQIYNALMATQIFHKGPATYGLLGTIIAIGSLSAALLSAKLDARRGVRFTLKFAFLFGASLIVTSIAPNYILYAVALPFVGMLALTMMISANSYIQGHTDPAIRGRVMGIYLMVFMGGTPFGSPLIGWLCTQIGVRQSIALCGAITAIAPALIFASMRDRLIAPESVKVDDVLVTFYENK